MRIERIGKNTVNVYITQNDLAIRHLSFSTLKEDSADYTKLVWDAIDHANIEFGREFDDRQLKIVDKFDADGCLILTISHDPDDKGDVNEVEHYSIMYSPTLEEVAFPPVINKEEGKISLEYPSKPENPWFDLVDKYKVNDIVTCKVVKFATFGAFLEIEEDLEGLVHNSEITSLKRVIKPEDELKLGQTINAKIISIDKEKLKIGLSIKEIEGTSAEYGYEEYIRPKKNK